ncbi:hypothetical protein FOZ63_008687, partial [Perkinsus olseni]
CKLKVSPSAVGEDGETVKVSVSASSPMTTMSITYSGLPVLPREQESQDGQDGAPAIRPLSVTVHTRRLLNMINVSGVKLDTPPVVMVCAEYYLSLVLLLQGHMGRITTVLPALLAD